MTKFRVGVFDSGVGGLTVLGECARLLPEARFFYLGDNGNAPYGSRPAEEIRSLVRAALERFETLGVDAVVLACNTATAVCAEEMRRSFSFPIVGMEPAVKLAAAGCRRALVLCTPVTAASERLKGLIASCPACSFVVAAAEGLAGEIEEALKTGRSARLADFLPAPPVTSHDPALCGAVLGCTHYLFFRREIARFYQVPVFDGNLGTAKRLAFVLKSAGNKIQETENGIGDHENTPFFDADRPANPPVFLGKWAKLNETIYNSNIRSQNFL